MSLDIMYKLFFAVLSNAKLRIVLNIRICLGITLSNWRILKHKLESLWVSLCKSNSVFWVSNMQSFIYFTSATCSTRFRGRDVFLIMLIFASRVDWKTRWLGSIAVLFFLFCTPSSILWDLWWKNTCDFQDPSIMKAFLQIV